MLDFTAPIPETSGTSTKNMHEHCWWSISWRGNFRANPVDAGPSQIFIDADGDGIGDSPYNVDGDHIDYLSLK